MSKDKSFIGSDRLKERYNDKKQGAPYKEKVNSPSYKFSNLVLDDIIARIPKDGNFLDAGCATASFLEQLIFRAKATQRSDIKFFAFDFSQDYLDDAHKRNLDADIFYDDLRNLTSEQIKKNKFDYIFSKDVLFFLNDDEREPALKSLKDLLRPEGILKIWIREKKEGPQNPRFNDFTKEEFEDCLKKSGFEIEKLEIGEKASYGEEDPKDLEKNKFNRMIAVTTPRELELEDTAPKKNPASPNLDSSSKRPNQIF